MAGVALVIDFFEGLEEIQAKGNVNKIFQFQAEIKSQFVYVFITYQLKSSTISCPYNYLTR